MNLLRDLGLTLSLYCHLEWMDPQSTSPANNATSFIDIGSCPLHSANNVFSEGLKLLKDCKSGPNYLRFTFFLFSKARREDYKGVSSITEITSHFVLKHF